MAAGTIVAVSSPPGGGARAVLRLSGPEAGALVQAGIRCQAHSSHLDAGARPGIQVGRVCLAPYSRLPRGVYCGSFDDGEGLVPCFWFWMPGPASFTREDVSELHIPGSPPLVEAVLDALVRAGARLAEPGEFTRRAFQNGRIDLTRAEGVLGLIEAADLAAARSSAALLFGGLAERVAALRGGLDSLRALAEASLDFDTTETGHVETAALAARAETLAQDLTEALAWEQRRQSSHGRPRIVLAGRPNAGKSSLFNVLTVAGIRCQAPSSRLPTQGFNSRHPCSKREEGAWHRIPALVSDFAGSTRDGKAAAWLVAGVELELFDAPGFDFSAHTKDDDPDQKAQVLADATRGGADVILWLLPTDSTTPEEAADDRAKLPTDALVIPVVTKTDLGAAKDLLAKLERIGGAEGQRADGSHPEHLVPLLISTTADPAAARVTLEARVATALGLAPAPAARVTASASLGRELSARHRAALAHSLAALDEARTGLAQGLPLDLVAETLRAATDELDSISGETTPEDLLDRIFAGFCLGK